MKIPLPKSVSFCLLMLLLCRESAAQLGAGTYTSEAINREFAVRIDKRTLDQVPRRQLLEGEEDGGHFLPEMPIGILGSSAGPPIELNVYSFDPNPANRKFLYGVYSTSADDTEWSADYYPAPGWTDCWNCDVESNDIKKNAGQFLFEEHLRALDNPGYIFPGAYFLPVIVELIVPSGATVKAIKVPGVPSNDLNHYFPQEVYDIQVDDTTFLGLPVYALRGGMSAEYAVQKSIADLAGGISHTWAVRDIDAVPDLAGGGPVSVYGKRNFLDSSVQKTVDLYNDELGSSTSFPTVIISTGVASIPYMSSVMKAPVLPLHFLVSVNTIAQVDSIVRHANANGYSCYATAGYDHSIPDAGVAWIKLLEMPQAYLDFLEDHSVQNVILAGLDERGFGESDARRVIIGDVPTETYGEGSIYLMKANSGVNYENLNKVYIDYGQYAYQEEKLIADWEGGILDVQIENFSAAIRAMTSPPFPISIHTITSFESLRYYELAIDLALEFWKKNSSIVGSDPITGVALNEYLIGYPMYEARVGQVPFLYWQDPSFNTFNVDRVMGRLQYKITSAFPSMSTDFEDLNFHINAKYDRSALQTELQSRGLTSVTMNSWQKADVYDPSDGFDAPVEQAAEYINNNIGVISYQSWVNSLTPLDDDDLSAMASNSTENRNVAGAHPAPDHVSTVIFLNAGGGPVIKKYSWDADAYWQVKNYAHYVEYHDVSNAYPGTFEGWLDGKLADGEARKQDITIAEFDLTDTGDEYDLKMDYVFDPHDQDNFPYDPADGREQDMACFEYVKVPHTSWMDIPSRVMARNGAVWVVNGTVYDWDYNGMPGVVPFVKKDGEIKAQPEMLTYKAEAYMAWDWGATKNVVIGHRPAEISGDGLVSTLETLYQAETSSFPNVLSGMTYMTGSGAYDIEGLQPSWMTSWPAFPKAYLGPSGTAIRCFLADPGAGCENILEETGGMAPIGEGWNDCGSLADDSLVQRISALAYRQYDKLFDQVPNARTFVAIKDNQLDIGIIDGDLGDFSDPRGVIASKTSGMRNWEVSNFVQYKGYDHFMHLDGGSSTQMWLNGRGPLHDWSGYPLIQDNQGPYYSRLGSTVIMLIPKFHTGEISPYQSTGAGHLIMDNSDISFNYSDAIDHSEDKAFVGLSPNLDSLRTDAGDGYGILAGNFKIGNEASGAILFSAVEDSYYPDTEGTSPVIPVYRNAVVVGVGKIPGPLIDSLSKPTRHSSFQAAYNQILSYNEHAFYYIKLYRGEITEYFIEKVSYDKYIDNKWHSFLLSVEGSSLVVSIDDVDISRKETGLLYHHPSNASFMVNDDSLTHAMIGAVNVDGRFVTGDALLHVDNFLIATGLEAYSAFSANDRAAISSELYGKLELPSSLSSRYYNPRTYALQFEEEEGQHSFSAEPTQNVRFYGLNLNTQHASSGGGARVAGDGEVLINTLEPHGDPGIRIYPNPSPGEVTVEITLDNASPVHLMIYDLNGRVVWNYEGYLEAGSYAMYIEDLKRYLTNGGIYIMKASSRSMQRTGKIILQ